MLGPALPSPGARVAPDYCGRWVSSWAALTTLDTIASDLDSYHLMHAARGTLLRPWTTGRRASRIRTCCRARADGSGARVPRATAGGVALAGKRRHRATREGVSLAADRSVALLRRGGQASAGAQPVPPVHGSGRRGTAQRDRPAAGNLGRPPAVSVYVPTGDRDMQRAAVSRRR